MPDLDSEVTVMLPWLVCVNQSTNNITLTSEKRVKITLKGLTKLEKIYAFYLFNNKAFSLILLL